MKINTQIVTLLLLLTLSMEAQNYEFGIVHEANNTFKVVAIPDFNSFETNASNETVDISDVGFTLMLPTGPSEIQNVVSILSGRTWNLNVYDASFLSGLGLGDGTKDAFLLTMNPGQSIVSHVATAQIDLMRFDVINAPTSGNLYFLENTDPIALGAGNVLDSFFNADIDGPGTGAGTSDYYGGNDTGLASYPFELLSIASNESLDIKIYPNPASHVINIQHGIANIISLEIYNANGKLILQELHNTSQINVENISNGLYFLRITSREAETIRKVIIKR